LTQLRAQLSGYAGNDVLGDFLPSKLDKLHTRTYLFNQTRHTPRDFFQMLTNIQNYASAGRIPVKHVFSGLREYSFKYFLPEIRDELAGYLSPDEANLLLDLLASIHKKQFTFDELQKHAASSPRYSRLDLQAGLAFLFECSAVGNVTEQENGKRWFHFKYRNQNVSANQSERFQLHPGTWKAFGLGSDDVDAHWPRRPPLKSG
jgi:hypothetical protein